MRGGKKSIIQYREGQGCVLQESGALRGRDRGERERKGDVWVWIKRP